MSVEAMALVLHHSKATGTDKLVLLGIANHEGDGGSWPRVSTLARYANIKVRGVQKVLRKLEEMGELRTELNAGGSWDIPAHERSNRYTVLVTCPPNCDRSTNHKLIDDEEEGVSHRTPPRDVQADTRGVSHRTPPPVSKRTRGGVSRRTSKPSSQPSGEPNVEIPGFSGGAALRSVPAGDATEPPTETSSTTNNGDGSAAPRRPDRCTKPEHQNAERVTESCVGCMNARQTHEAGAALREVRIRDRWRELENMPACDHGQPGGDQPNPLNPSRLLCALCTAGRAAEAPTGPTAADTAALRSLAEATA